MTYTDPFSHGAVESTIEAVISDADATYTIVTEIDAYIGMPIVHGNLDDRYDIMVSVNAHDARRACSTLIELGRAVMVINGSVASRDKLPEIIPAGYVFPDGVWCKVSN